MLILGIDTSCDDTCISVLKFEIRNSKSETKGKGINFNILSNIVSSQVKLHAKYGGVYPFLAKREHQKNLPVVFNKALRQAQAKLSDIDIIGVTVGPGLEPCLWQGVNFAKDLVKKLKKPLIPVNHLEAHILANWLRPIHENSKFQNSKLFPAVCLVVSGGHTQLILMKDIGRYKLIGETRDDAAGECFDKVARILGLGYPGGPIISRLAKDFIGRERFSLHLPRPMMYTKDYDFSFSGLKTAVLYDFRKRSPKTRKSKKYIQKMCHEIQQTIIDVLIHKTIKAAKDFRTKSIILGGGVVANEELRKQFKEKIKKELPKIYYLKPETYLCTDNAAMVAATTFFHKEEKFDLQEIKAEANLKLQPFIIFSHLLPANGPPI